VPIATAKSGKDLTTGNIQAVISDLAAAFARYPLCKWILAGVSDEDYARRRLFEIIVRDMLIDKAEFVHALDHAPPFGFGPRRFLWSKEGRAGIFIACSIAAWGRRRSTGLSSCIWPWLPINHGKLTTICF